MKRLCFIVFVILHLGHSYGLKMNGTKEQVPVKDENNPALLETDGDNMFDDILKTVENTLGADMAKKMNMSLHGQAADFPDYPFDDEEEDPKPRNKTTTRRPTRTTRRPNRTTPRRPGQTCHWKKIYRGRWGKAKYTYVCSGGILI